MKPVKQTGSHHHRHLYILGSGHQSHGHVSTDFAGPFLGRTFLIVVDAHSKWLEVTPVASTSQQVVRVLGNVFSTHGLPDVIVSDNGTAFTSVVLNLYEMQWH